MPRPNPLQNISSAYSSTRDYQSLTPRTPHSRAGRAEEARHGLDITKEEEEDYELELELALARDGNPYGSPLTQQQHEPLLASSASGSFPHHGARSSHVDQGKAKSSMKAEGGLSWDLVLARIPLVTGLATALLLLVFIILSVEKPESLHAYFGAADLDAVLEGELHATPTAEESAPGVVAMMKGPMGTYWHVPPEGPADVAHSDSKGHSGICTSSITYMLDGQVGLAADLALMAQAAGLAREDDSNWNRGKWTDHFQDVRPLQPGPEPGCLPPPPEELVACPRTARHWVINSRTAVFHFGHMFMDEYEDPYSRELRRLKLIFARAAYSLAHTIRPNAKAAALIQAARRELAGTYVSVHVRHGDRKTEAWAFRGEHVPLPDYVRAARDAWARLVPNSSDSSDSPAAVYLASDDPTVHADFAELLAEADPTARVVSLETSENVELAAIASGSAYVQSEFNALGQEERVRSTRGALVDFALLSGLWAWDGEDGSEARLEATVCTISSNFCKLAAVGLGWERAFGFLEEDTTQMDIDDSRKRWVEIDNAGSIIPVWRPFELFW
ncbi:hypothetical protein DFH11DRAFT_1730151 [Phellopilus nigrolimitatus]|nr:hypothetical protein DFH11DRAFT_1730151 [Phellopilus nigrolimitatus]